MYIISRSLLCIIRVIVMNVIQYYIFRLTPRNADKTPLGLSHTGSSCPKNSSPLRITHYASTTALAHLIVEDVRDLKILSFLSSADKTLLHAGFFQNCNP